MAVTLVLAVKCEALAAAAGVSADRLHELAGIEHSSRAHHPGDAPNVRDVGEWISVEKHEVGKLARRHVAQVPLHPQHPRTADGRAGQVRGACRRTCCFWRAHPGSIGLKSGEYGGR